MLDFTVPSDQCMHLQNKLEEIDMQVSSDDIINLKEKLFLDKKDFQILETIQQTKKETIGSIYKCTLKGIDAACKII